MSDRKIYIASHPFLGKMAFLDLGEAGKVAEMVEIVTLHDFDFVTREEFDRLEDAVDELREQLGKP